MKRYLHFVLLILIISLMCGCAPLPSESGENTFSPVDFITAFDTVDHGSIGLSDNNLIETLRNHFKSIPDNSEIYSVQIGSKNIPSNATEVKFTELDYTAEELMAALVVLPKLQNLYLANNPLSKEHMNHIAQFYPDLNIEYTVNIMGSEYDTSATQVNLAGITQDNYQDITRKLQLLPALEYVELMDENGQCYLTKTEVKYMLDALPEIQIHYSFDFFGTTISTTDESVILCDVPIGNEGEDEIRQTLDILRNCNYFKLDDCGIDSEIMASIREDYPEIKVVWRIYCGRFSICTDDTMCRMTNGLNDSNCSELKYCTDVTYLDIGHNETLTDISFTKYMTNLECIIISGSSVTDVTPLADHDKLTWVEFVFCGSLSDISCLSTCDNIRFLNVSYTRVSDISALENLPLERFNSMMNNVSYADSLKFVEWHPDCISVFRGVQPYGYGWRYNDHGYTFFEYYANMRIVFRYDDTTFHSCVKGR